MKDLLYLKDEQLKDLIEKLFIVYRDTFTDPKKILNPLFFIQLEEWVLKSLTVRMKLTQHVKK